MEQIANNLWWRITGFVVVALGITVALYQEGSLQSIFNTHQKVNKTTQVYINKPPDFPEHRNFYMAHILPHEYETDRFNYAWLIRLRHSIYGYPISSGTGAENQADSYLFCHFHNQFDKDVVCGLQGGFVVQWKGGAGTIMRDMQIYVEQLPDPHTVRLLKTFEKGFSKNLPFKISLPKYPKITSPLNNLTFRTHENVGAIINMTEYCENVFTSNTTFLERSGVGFTDFIQDLYAIFTIHKIRTDTIHFNWKLVFTDSLPKSPKWDVWTNMSPNTPHKLDTLPPKSCFTGPVVFVRSHDVFNGLVHRLAITPFEQIQRHSHMLADFRYSIGQFIRLPNDQIDFPINERAKHLTVTILLGHGLNATADLFSYLVRSIQERSPYPDDNFFVQFVDLKNSSLSPWEKYQLLRDTDVIVGASSMVLLKSLFLVGSKYRTTASVVEIVMPDRSAFSELNKSDKKLIEKFSKLMNYCGYYRILGDGGGNADAVEWDLLLEAVDLGLQCVRGFFEHVNKQSLAMRPF